MAKRKFDKLTDRRIRAVTEFYDDPITELPRGPVTLWDERVHGLKIRIGKHRATWVFHREHQRRGNRTLTFRRLGTWPSVSVKDARKAAERQASANPEPGKTKALLFTDAWEKYCDYLKTSKSATWHKIVVGLGKLYLIPQWQGWSLAEISQAPEQVRDWHASIKSPVVANKCARLLRACYRFNARLRRDLPHHLPTSGVTFHREEPRQAGMKDAQHREWGEAWRKIENPTRKAYQLAAILTGMRPGELSRAKAADVHDDHFVIRKAKAGADIWVPLSAPIKAAIQMALDAGQGSEWVFPGRNGDHIKKFDIDGLPCWGNGLRHNFKNIAVTMQPPVSEILQELLQGHTPKGVSRKYVATMVIAQSDALRDAQERISKRIVGLLGIKL